jgi:DNA recombination protein RmuC
MREQLRQQFENLANRILEEKTDKFTKLNQSQLETILNPLQTKLKEFEAKVDQTYRIEAAERNSLKGEILKLTELNKQISDEAANLTRALKGDTKKQGNWGELILEKVLEYSGLRKDEEYVLQESHTSDDGRRQQPDVIVKLPEGKHIIIDSKVSLIAYDRFVAAETETDRDSAIAEHVASVRSHIKGLSDKNYPGLGSLNAPDFTLLFMPIESSFGLAVQADADLFSYAWERKIVIVSPSTLLATLRTIASIWKQERQTKNALDIADQAGKMYDKLVGFVEDLIAVGKKMDDAKKSYTDAMGKLHSGTGNLVRRAEQMKELGIKASKQLPPSLLDRAE